MERLREILSMIRFDEVSQNYSLDQLLHFCKLIFNSFKAINRCWNELSMISKSLTELDSYDGFIRRGALRWLS